MNISFSKYQGTGNDFIMLDNLSGNYDALTLDQIRFLCDRKLGVGADGLIKISKDENFDFNVEYYNSDGKLRLTDVFIWKCFLFQMSSV